MTTPTARPVTRPRLIVPDIARGLTLAGIAIANATSFWTSTEQGDAAVYGGVVNDSVLDKIAVVFGTISVHNRGVTMFAFLLGYGLAMLWSSLERRHYPTKAATLVLVRRYGFLALLGAIHAVVIFYGDIMLFYGLCGMLIAPMLRLSDKALAWIAAGLGALGLLVGPVLFLIGMMGEPLIASKTYLEQVLWGLLIVVTAPINFVPQALVFLPLMLLGVLAGRHNILGNPDKHRRLLVWVAAVGAMCAVVAGLLSGLAAVGMGPVSLPVAQAINQDLGLATGPGIVAVIALVCAPVQRRISAAAENGETYTAPFGYRLLAALGARSMSGYVAQSILFTIFVAPYGLGWATFDGAWELTLAGFGVWVVTLLGAWALGERRGPFEVLHRRLSYGREGLAADYRTRHPQGVPVGAYPQVVPQPGVQGPMFPAPGQQPPVVPGMPPAQQWPQGPHQQQAAADGWVFPTPPGAGQQQPPQPPQRPMQ